MEDRRCSGNFGSIIILHVVSVVIWFLKQAKKLEMESSSTCLEL